MMSYVRSFPLTLTPTLSVGKFGGGWGGMGVREGPLFCFDWVVNVIHTHPLGTRRCKQVRLKALGIALGEC